LLICIQILALPQAAGILQTALRHQALKASCNQSNFTGPVRTNAQECLAKTGGTCILSKCSDFRGATMCIGSNCLCFPGFCSSAEGQCLKSANQRIAKKVRLRNARYSNQYVAIGSRNIYITENHLDPNTFFDIWRMPSITSFPGYLLFSQDGGRVVGIRPGEAGLEMKPWSLPLAAANFASFWITAAPPYEGAPPGMQSIVIEGFGFRSSVLYSDDVHHRVGIHVPQGFGSVGVGAYWIPEPPIIEPLPTYTGSKCFWDCGSYNSGSKLSVRWGLTVTGMLLYWIALLASVVLLCFLCYQLP